MAPPMIIEPTKEDKTEVRLDIESIKNFALSAEIERKAATNTDSPKSFKS